MKRLWFLAEFGNKRYKLAINWFSKSRGGWLRRNYTLLWQIEEFWFIIEINMFENVEKLKPAQIW